MLFAILGVTLGLGFVCAGRPTEGAHEAQGCARLAFAAFVAVFAPVLSVGVVTTGMPNDVATVAMLLVFFVSGSLWVSQRLASPLVRPLARWLEPDLDLDAYDGRTRVFRAIDDAKSALRAGFSESTAERAREQFAIALRHLDEGEKIDAESSRPIWQGSLALVRAETLLALGDLEGAKRVAQRFPDETALCAELARRRGDPERAAAIAQEWLDGATRADPSGLRVPASALALLALARCDQGRLDGARRHLEAAKAIPSWYPRAFEHLKPEAVERYIESRG